MIKVIISVLILCECVLAIQPYCVDIGINDAEKRMASYEEFAKETTDPKLIRLWTDKADLERANILFLKKYFND